MKVLFDCIVTAEPRKCSTTIQFWLLAQELLKTPHTFIYWPIPDSLTDEERDWYPKDDRILYLPIRQLKDRMREYAYLNPDMAKLISFYSPLTWDWDVLVTVRCPQMAQMRLLATSPRTGHMAASRKIIAIEDMMVLSKKPTVFTAVDDVQDRQLIDSYLAADAVLIPAYHEKAWVMQVAKDYYSPAMQKKLMNRMREVCQLQISKFDFGLKTTFKYDGKRKLGVAFVGRLERFGTRLNVMNDMLKNQWILNSDTVRSFVCTVTEGDQWLDTDAIEVLHPYREEFWRIAREEMDVALGFSIDVELNLSKLEPIMFGVPLIVIRAPWSIGMLGPDYPFFVKSETEGFALVNVFKAKYDEMYAKFSAWFNDWFVPEYTRRETEDGMYEWLLREIVDFHPEDLAPLSTKTNRMVKKFIEVGGSEFDMERLCMEATDEDLKAFSKKFDLARNPQAGLIWLTDMNYYRLGLKKYWGYRDASVAAGHMETSGD